MNGESGFLNGAHQGHRPCQECQCEGTTMTPYSRKKYPHFVISQPGHPNCGRVSTRPTDGAFRSTERNDQSTRPSKIRNEPNRSLKSFIIFVLENPARHRARPHPTNLWVKGRT